MRWQQSPDRDGLARKAWHLELNCPQTSAAGRVFDAASSLVCGLDFVSFEAQGPMFLESLCRSTGERLSLPLAEDGDGILRSDWQPLISMLSDDAKSAAWRAEAFHSSMAHVILDQARRIREREHLDRVGLCGGVFQNRVLTEQAVELLRQNGFEVHLGVEMPCNDAALSFGQAAEVAAREMKAAV